MIDALDEVLRELLIKEMPVKNGEIDISFDQPRREWTARLSRPTINLFLYDLKENTKLRSRERSVVSRNGSTAVQRQAPLRMDLRYMITAWATEPEDEHRLLTRALIAFYRNPVVPTNLLPEILRNQPVPIPVEVAQPYSIQNLTDVWSVLDNELRPAINCDLTIALDPLDAWEGPLVRTRELRVAQAVTPVSPYYESSAGENTPLQKVPGAGEAQYWTIGGAVETKVDISDIQIKIQENGQPVPLDEEGRFTIGNLRAGEYTLEIDTKGRTTPKLEKISVPAPDYLIKV